MQFPIILGERRGESCGPVALGVAGSGSKAGKEVPELIPIITAHTINYKYKQHVSDSAGGREDGCQSAGCMLIRIPLAMGYLGNSLSSLLFPNAAARNRERAERGSEFPDCTIQGQNIRKWIFIFALGQYPY